MPASLMIGANVFFALFALITIIQSLRKKVRAGCWIHGLLFIGIILFVASIITNTATMLSPGASSDTDASNLTLLAAIGVGPLIVSSIVAAFLDRRSEQYQRIYSRGILGLISGLMLAFAFIIIPIIPNNIIPIPTPTAVAAAIQSNQSDGMTIVPTEAAAVSNAMFADATPTITRTPLPSPSPTRTRRAYVPPTITPTPDAPAVPEGCGATVLTNLNVRGEPNTDADIVTVIPQDEYVSLSARNADSTWWQLSFQGEQGWVSGDFLQFDSICVN